MQRSLRIAPPVDYSLNPQPIDVIMALTNTCNHRCVFCQYHKAISKPVCMPREKGRYFLEQAIKLGGGGDKRVWFWTYR